MEIIEKNEYAIVAYEKEYKLVSITWTGKRPSFENYKYPFEKAVEFQIKSGAYNYVSDMREAQVVPPQFRTWLQKELIPVGVKQGLLRIAIVDNVNVFKKYYINHIFNTSKKLGISLKIFRTTDEAKAWFKTYM